MLVVLVTMAIFLADALEAGAQPVTVKVQTSWDGLGAGDAPARFTVSCPLAECPDSVRRLLQCLDAPRKTRLDADDLADEVSWLQSATPEELRVVNNGAHHALYSVYSSARVRAAFESARADPELVLGLLLNYYDPRHFWTDDYPHASATVTLPNGETVVLTSQAQQAYMVPWTVTRSGTNYTTYDFGIGPALAALGPARFLGRERLAGSGLRARLVGELFDLAYRKEGPKP